MTDSIRQLVEHFLAYNALAYNERYLFVFRVQQCLAGLAGMSYYGVPVGNAHAGGAKLL